MELTEEQILTLINIYKLVLGGIIIREEDSWKILLQKDILAESKLHCVCFIYLFIFTHKN